MRGAQGEAIKRRRVKGGGKLLTVDADNLTHVCDKDSARKEEKEQQLR